MNVLCPLKFSAYGFEGVPSPTHPTLGLKFLIVPFFPEPVKSSHLSIPSFEAILAFFPALVTLLASRFRSNPFVTIPGGFTFAYTPVL